MATEDALFRVLLPTAEVVADKCRHNGKDIDLDKLTEEVLDAFRPVIQYGAYEASVRQRLRTFLSERMGAAR